MQESQPHAVAHQHLELLTPPEANALVKETLDLFDRGSTVPWLGVHEMAIHLLNSRDIGLPSPISKRWYIKFMKQHDDVLRTRLTRLYDYLRARAEDPDVICTWVRLVESTIERYGIIKGDVYSTDETGFLHGKVASEKVVNRKEPRAIRPRKTQPGSREYTAVLDCTSGAGKSASTSRHLPWQSTKSFPHLVHGPTCRTLCRTVTSPLLARDVSASRKSCALHC